MAEMGTKEILEVINAWEGETKELARQKDISHVMIFENKGAMMGCSNPHPHCQIWATENIPDIPRRILDSEKRYFASHSSHILADYVRWELEKGERLVAKNDHWVALVPYWAVWPFEVMMLPVTGSPASIEQLSSEQRAGWGALLREVLIRYDNLFQSSFPYSMGVYQKPVTGEEYAYHTLHQSFFPPLLRSSEVKKHMVGYELCAEPQRDLTPELAAAKLRESGGAHYRRRR